MTETKALVPIGQRVENALVERRTFLDAIFQGDARRVDRFIKTAALAVATNPDLARCTFESIVVSIVEAAEVGLEVGRGSLSRAWLVPFTEKGGPTKAQLIVGYMGLLDLAKRSGEVVALVAHCVYEGDDFTIEQGTVERIVHVPRYQTEDPTKIYYVYANALLRGGGTIHEVMTRKQVEGIRAMSKARNATAWTEHWDEMARKTVVRRLAKYLQMTPEAVAVIEREEEREFAPSAPVDPVARTASLKEALRAQTGPPEALKEEPIEGEAIEVILHPVDVEAPPSEEPQIEQPSVTEPTVTVVMADTATIQTVVSPNVCGVLSPYGDGGTCVLLPGHRRAHLTESKATW